MKTHRIPDFDARAHMLILCQKYSGKVAHRMRQLKLWFYVEMFHMVIDCSVKTSYKLRNCYRSLGFDVKPVRKY